MSHTFCHTHQQPKFGTPWVTAEEEEKGYRGWRGKSLPSESPTLMGGTALLSSQAPPRPAAEPERTLWGHP